MVVEPLFKVFTEGVLANPADGAEDDDDDDDGGLIFNKEEVELGAQQVRGRQHLSLPASLQLNPSFFPLDKDASIMAETLLIFYLVLPCSLSSPSLALFI